MIQFVLMPLFLLLCAGIILWWTQGMRMRRFNKAYSKECQACWTADDQPFLRYIESAYGLPQGAAGRLPETETPMGLYLVLYPEHCIYDANENVKFLRVFYRGKEVPLHSDLLTERFRTLAQQWLEVKEMTDEADTFTH